MPHNAQVNRQKWGAFLSELNRQLGLFHLGAQFFFLCRLVRASLQGIKVSFSPTKMEGYFPVSKKLFPVIKESIEILIVVGLFTS